MSLDASVSEESPSGQQFQPGQLGLVHLLGLMGAVSAVAALSAAALRELSPRQAAIVIGHWMLVATVAGLMIGVTSLRRRRERTAAGGVLLRVLGRPITYQTRRVISWLLLAAVVLDGVVMSVFVLPSDFLMAVMFQSPIVLYLAIAQAILWRYCLDHWVTNVYVVEFCEHGILTCGKFFRWKRITRLVWSPVRPMDLVIVCEGFVNQVRIDPAAHAKVNEFLAMRQAARATGRE